MNEAGDTLIYLYGIAPGDSPDPPLDLKGLEDAPVRLVRTSGVSAIVSDVPSHAYADDELNARLEDLAWVGERGVAHERVLDAFAAEGAVLPLSLFSLHRDEDRLRERIAESADRYASALEGLAGRREWGIKIWRRQDAAEHVERLSPALAALSKEMEDAAPGRRYLLERKRDNMRGEEIRVASKRLAHRIYELLAEAAEHSVSSPLPAAQAEGARVLLLSAAFLVSDDSFQEFHRRVSEAAHEAGGAGFDVEFTGPWPPYHFADLNA